MSHTQAVSERKNAHSKQGDEEIEEERKTTVINKCKVRNASELI
jgi:hypothetical protein